MLQTFFYILSLIGTIKSLFGLFQNEMDRPLFFKPFTAFSDSARVLSRPQRTELCFIIVRDYNLGLPGFFRDLNGFVPKIPHIEVYFFRL